MKVIDRRQFIGRLGAGAFVTTIGASVPVPMWARSGSGAADIRKLDPSQRYDLDIAYQPFHLNGGKERVRATAINGTVPGPLMHWREGDTVELNVTNSLMDTKHASIHWHGILVPFRMDGVPGVNFAGIKPGETFTYRYKLVQSGTYWYHSHSAFQEQTGAYGPLVIEPRGGEAIRADRDYTVVLSDWTSDGPHAAFRNVTMSEGYYNFQQRTLGDLFKDFKERGFKDTVAERLAWGKMRMSPVDLAGITGAEYTYLMNGQAPDSNWTALFNPGETVRLRFINAGAMSTFDVRIPGLDMQVVMVDGKAVKPVEIHEFRISVAETYDVLVRPKKDQPFTIFAESLDRSGYARGTLSPQMGLSAPVPELRERPVRRLDDIGMGMMGKKIFGGGEMDHGSMQMDSGMQHGPRKITPDIPGPVGPEPFMPEDNVNAAMIIMNPLDRIADPGIGLGDDGWKVLTHADLVSDAQQQYKPEVDREMTINITANMERFMFSFDGKKYSQHPGPYNFRHNERLRLWLVNHTMMEHPIHLHGMWMQIENGQPHSKIPYKHTILVKPGEKISTLVTPIEKGDWAFHCHLLYHMEAGMFQVVRVS
ncbi:copper resistance system multicopper oxidase [Pelagicoccus enzymogenes]|uniref:copper resistance system multicopper oxidase n=1 Tax=Pelagicoccus enzymogenes TaxID=2773457 RepID=UPI00280D8566|nr:copper resistance system multicopper oxidase [Pelagicoccus enzymogenes]MDQ8198208.1 copper resistance system multicopper oxidase [Pelagicoccus enzymogenes]